MSRRARSAIAGLAALAVVAYVLVTTFRPWRLVFEDDGGTGARSMWTAGGVRTLAAAGLLLGAVVVAVAIVTARARPRIATAAAAVGSALAVVGGVLVLVDRYATDGAAIAPVTVAIAGFSSGPDQFLFDRPVASWWVVVAVAVTGALAVAAVSSVRSRPAPVRPGASRAIVAVATVGALVVAVAGSLLPWSVGNALEGQSVWMSGTTAAVGAVLVVVAGLLTVVAGVRAQWPAALAGLAAAAVGFGLLVAQRVPYLWGPPSIGVSSYGPLEDLGAGPSVLALHTATVLVLGGAALVALGASVATWLLAPPPTTTSEAAVAA